MISVVILTYNSRNFIEPCLDSVFAQDHQDFEVIIVDNGSKDETVSFIKEDYPQVNMIQNKENLGAARARNQGIEISRGDWILTLDCDTVLEKDFFSETSKAIESLPQNIGMIQPKILKSDRETIYSCGIYLSWLRRFYDIGREKLDRGQFNKSGRIFGSCCAGAFYRKDMLENIKEELGYFDERFFFLVEDVDLAWRAQKKGWRALFYPDVVCYHHGSSSGTSKEIRQCLCFRNRYLSIIKNDCKKGYFLPFIFYDIPRFLYLFFFNRYFLKTIKEIMELSQRKW